MNLSEYSLKELLLTALESEIESRSVYETLSNRVKNAFLRDRLAFLANEEKKHGIFIEGVYKKTFPQDIIILPDETPVPLPLVKIPTEDVPLSFVFEQAMEAEKASSEFYQGLVHQFQDVKIQKTLAAFAAMEMDHYRILEAEHKTMKRFETFDTEWPMMNVGP
ncbi:MAG: ferritin family protein [Theionarchaea archaeon]|nr:ferritin family protein [Theionarchaea archaeon]MBU7001333.1 ferritin family protein [Theionarchaea archaeon]MBU7019824.1 ferritin family protein [Theionarchaea archaeon]MBU7035137.1 ferritin family protein [Theionarchaea archaeon]MBU7040752.1 ferritin family protein [Theionarchaea archaeon]